MDDKNCGCAMPIFDLTVLTMRFGAVCNVGVSANEALDRVEIRFGSICSMLQIIYEDQGEK